MATPLSAVYDAFLARITADEWMIEDDICFVEKDWQQLLDMAIFRFKFPRVALDYDVDERAFLHELGNGEIQVLASYMRHEWLKRCVSNWENLKQLYATKTSQANHLQKLNQTVEAAKVDCQNMYSIYDRAISRTETGFHNLGGKKT